MAEQVTMAGLAERFGTRTGACRSWAAENMNLVEMRELLHPAQALAIRWPGGAEWSGGNRKQLSCAVAMAVRAMAERQMGAAAQREARMWR